MRVGQTIRVLRTARSVSQGAMARRLSVTPGYLSLVEQDKREPSLSFLKRVGEYFNVPVGFLLLAIPSSEHANPEHKRLLREIRHAMLDFLIFRPDQEQPNKRSKIRK